MRSARVRGGAVLVRQQSIGRVAHQDVPEPPAIDATLVPLVLQDLVPRQAGEHAGQGLASLDVQQRLQARPGEALAKDARRTQNAAFVRRKDADARLQHREHCLGHGITVGVGGADQLLQVQGVAARLSHDARAQPTR